MISYLVDDVTHVDTSTDGTVWYSWRGQVPASSGAAVPDFCVSQLCPSASRVRLVGSFANSALIAQLFQQQQAGGPVVELATPKLAATRKSRSSSESMLVSMCNLSASTAQWQPSIGGWHPVTASEALIYQAAGLPVGADDDAYVAILREHPLWAALQFIPHLDPAPLSALLICVRDPRWYIDLQDPDTSGPLIAYLGLRRNEFVAEAQIRAQNVLNCWKTTVEPPLDLLETPGAFLWRYWSLTNMSVRMSNLLTSLLFVQFVRQLWLDLIYREQRKGGEPLFVPEYYFSRAEEAQAFRAHMRQLGCAID